MNDFTLVRKNLFRRKLRAFLMIASILVAFLIFGILAGVYASFTAGEDRAAADRLVVVNKVNFTQPLPIAYCNRVRSVAGVRQVAHANWFGGYYQDPRNVLIVMAVEPETYTDVYARDYDLAPEARQAFIRTRTGALVDETRSFGKDTTGWLVLQTANPADNDRVAKAVDAMFANSFSEDAANTEKAFNKAFAAQ